MKITPKIRKKTDKEIQTCVHVPEASKDARNKRHFFIENYHCATGSLWKCSECGMRAYKDNQGKVFALVGNREVYLGHDYDNLGALVL